MTAKAYLLPESSIEFLASGGDVVLTLTSLAAANGRQSAQHDFGTSAHVATFEWRAFVQFATNPVVGEAISIYLKTSDGTHIDNDDGTGDAAVSAEDKLKNLTYLGAITVDEASATPEFSASGRVTIAARYLQIVFWNGTADALSSTASEHGLILHEKTWQAQDT